MLLQMVVHRLRSFFLFVVGLIKRALCCFRRRGKPSFDSVPLTDVGIIPNNALSSVEEEGPQMVNWNSWEEGPTIVVTDRLPDTVQQHIELYRQRVARQKSVSEQTEEETDPNFFQDMTPRITRQPKIILRNKENELPNSSRLALSVDPVAYTSPDLDVWEDTPGWEDQTGDEWDPDTILREKKMLERQKRLDEQKRKKQEKEESKTGRVHVLGARLS